MTFRDFPIAFAVKRGRNLARIKLNKGVIVCSDVI